MSGSYYDGSGSGSGSGIGSEGSLLVIFLALAPLICGATVCIILTIKYCILDEIMKKCKNIKYNCIRKYTIYIEEKRNPPPIQNNKLSPHFIKECNKTNRNTDTDKKSLDCSICLDEINIEDYKKTPNDLIFLNCSHVYHTECLQNWTETQVKNGRSVNCPLCREHIVIDIPKIVYNYDSDASEASEASYWND